MFQARLPSSRARWGSISQITPLMLTRSSHIDWLKVIFLVEAKTAVRLGSTSWFADVGLDKSDSIGGLLYFFLFSFFFFLKQKTTLSERWLEKWLHWLLKDNEFLPLETESQVQGYHIPTTNMKTCCVIKLEDEMNGASRFTVSVLLQLLNPESWWFL